MIYCNNCGKPLADGSMFCDGCGSPVAGPQNAPMAPKRSKKGPVIAIIASAVGLSLLGGGIFAAIKFAGKAKAPKETEDETYSYTESSDDTDETTETTDDILTTDEETSETTNETTTEETVESSIGETGDDETKTLEKAISPEELQRTIDNMKDSDTFRNNYKDATIEVRGNTITYKYYYNKEMTEDQRAQVKQNLENSGLREQIDGMKDSFEKVYGVRPERIAFEYYTADDILIACIDA